MSYHLGIDLGTTYTAAAVRRGDRVEIVGLGGRAPSVPSVLLLRDDETVLVGEAATRRAMTEPERVAREFKRRVGDPTPLLLAGTPYSAEVLAAKVLRWVVDRVTELEGGTPDHTTVTHPANWGPYKQDLLSQAIRMADLGETATLTEPEAAAIAYAHNERVEPGSLLAVYDLGGGTFDAAVLRKTGDGFEILGEPEGIERLGGIDFDEAVFAHVNRSLDGALDDLDFEDPAALAALARLRQECVEAKEALSADTDASIPVLLPGLQTEVRLTRAEFEGMIRPTLAETMGAMRRALDAAGVETDEVDAVLLVGGSSRIPLISQLVSAEFGRPVAVDAHPKHAIATGAALAAGASAAPGAAAEPDAATGSAAMVVGSVAAADSEPPLERAATGPEPLPDDGEATRPLASEQDASETPAAQPTEALDAPGPASEPEPWQEPEGSRKGSRRLVPLVAAAFALALLGGGAAFALLGGSDPDPDGELTAAADEAEATEPEDPADAEAEPLDRDENGATADADEAATEESDEAAPEDSEEAARNDEETVRDGEDASGGDPDPAGDEGEEDQADANADRAEITGITVADEGHYAVGFETRGFEPELPGQHVHFFFDTVPPEEAGVPGDGPWVLYGGGSPFTEYAPHDRPEGAERLCVLVANEDHSVQADSGNCHPLP